MMNFRTAFFTLFALGLFLTPTAGEEPAPVAGSSAASSASDPISLKIFFTGHLLGYYRLPEWQSADFEADCKAPKDYPGYTEYSRDEEDEDGKTDTDLKAEWNPDLWAKLPPQTPAYAFLSKYHRPDGDILVGMGDNFGVTLESRSYIDPKTGELHAKARDLIDPAHGNPWYREPMDKIGDNVGCFFFQAGYDALVPGKDDFYFGPERLRQIAGRLAKARAQAIAKSENKPEEPHPALMLASNMMLKTGYLKKPSDIQDSDKDLHFVPGMPIGIKSLDISDNGTIPPFTRQIRFEISTSSFYSIVDPDPEKSFDPFLCPVNKDDGLDLLNPDECESSKEASRPKIILTNRTKEKDDGSSGKTVWDVDLPAVWAPLPARYGLCTRIGPHDFEPRAGEGEKAYYIKQRKQHYYCERFTVAEPLFGEAETRPWVLKRLRRATDSKGAKTPDCKNASNASTADERCYKPEYAVIFGVVDKDLPSLIGRDNLAWRNSQPRTSPGKLVPAQSAKIGKETYGTTVDTLDEAATLGIAMRNFDLFWQKEHPGHPIYKVLLAQMTRGKAEALAANLADTTISDTSLRFDVVLSAATTFSAATTDEEVIYHRPVKAAVKTDPNKPPDPKKPEDKALPPFRQFVVVPWQAYDQGAHRAPNPLRSITLTDTGSRLKDSDIRNFVVAGQHDKWFPLSEPVDQDKLQACYDVLAQHVLDATKHYWKDQLPPSNAPKNLPDCTAASKDPSGKPLAPHFAQAFELAVLAALRDRTHADAAMLQKRSFYWGPFPLPLNGKGDLERANGELLERILWMGDYLEVLSVKGSTLKKVLDDSDKLDALDQQATGDLVETNRGLLAFGIEKTRDKQYLLDGMQIDPNRLYTVATSNHIAAGDNGYPELADPQFADYRLPGVDTNDKDAVDKTPRISSVVCDALEGKECVKNLGLLFATVQNSQQLPPQLSPGLPGYVRAYIRSIQGFPELQRDAFSRTNYQAQLNPNWRFSLKDFSFNLTSVRNNLSEAERVTELSGVTDPGAQNAKSHAIDFSSHFEWVRSGRSVDEFIRGLVEYQDTVTGNTAQVLIISPSGIVTGNVLYNAPALVTRSKNQGAVDSGLFLHGGHKYFDKLGLVLEPVHYDSQLATQELQFGPSYTNGVVTVPPVAIKPPQVGDFLSRLAFRSESDKNHFEAGYQGGWEFRALESVTTNVGSCPAQIITLCFDTLEAQTAFAATSLHLSLANRERHGPYADLDWSWPLLWRFSFRTQDSFAYYGPAHNDSPIDTLYRNDATQTLNFKLFPNLSIGPSLERFDYENKSVDGSQAFHLRTWSPSIKVTYSFEVLQGSHWAKSWRYSPSGGGGGQ
jgi:hypothetical protein